MQFLWSFENTVFCTGSLCESLDICIWFVKSMSNFIHVFMHYLRFHPCSCNNQRTFFRFHNMVVDELFHGVRYINRCLWTLWTYRLRTFWTIKHLHNLLLIQGFNVWFTAVQSNFAILSSFSRYHHNSSYEECDDNTKEEGVKSNPDFPVSSETHSWSVGGCDS